MRLGIDVDEVVAQLHEPWLADYSRNRVVNPTGRLWTPSDITQWEMEKDLGCTREQMMAFLTPELYDKVQPYPGAIAAVEAIEAMGHEVVFVTSCPDEDHFNAKYRWLKRYEFCADGRQPNVVAIGSWTAYQSKAEVAVDWLIDDHILHVESFPGHALLMTRPHNRSLQCTRKRVKSLGDVVRELKFARDSAPTVTNSRVTVSALPTDKQARKDTPITSGVLDYFSAAIAEVARVSKAGNDQHNPGQPLHWARGKSMDHADCITRHLMERGTVDDDGQRHSAKMAWRALALLQQELEDAGAPMSRASKVAA